MDPVPSTLPGGEGDSGPAYDPAERAAAAVSGVCAELIERAGPYCVAAKPQLACFERLGTPGRAALGRVVALAREAGLLVIADAKRADVPVSAEGYAASLLGSTSTPWGEVPGLGADAATVNPLLGADALEPFLAAAESAGAGLFALVRTSNAGAADLLDLPAPEAPLHERIATFVAARAPRLGGGGGLSGMGAVVGATQPQHIGRLRQLMPDSVFLLPGVGAQGGSASELGEAFGPGPPAALVAASRSIAGASDPGEAARRLRDEVWQAARGGRG